MGLHKGDDRGTIADTHIEKYIDNRELSTGGGGGDNMDKHVDKDNFQIRMLCVAPLTWLVSTDCYNIP